MKIGVNLKIDVTKIDKSKLFNGKNGAKYLDITSFIDIDVQGQYGDNGMATQKWKDQQKGEGIILGNSTVFWRDDGVQTNNNQQQAQQQAPPKVDNDFDIPF